MTTITKELTVTEKNEALFVERVIDYLDDGDICFAPVAKKVVRKPIAIAEADIMNEALDMLQSGDVEPVVTMDAETLDAIESEAIGEAFSTQPYLY